MVLEEGDMWTALKRTQLFCFTSNASITTRDRLVMGRGMALQVRNKFPDIDKMFAGAIGAQMAYGLAFVRYEHGDRGYNFCAFQVKHHYSDQASMDLIKMSANMLSDVVERDGLTRVDLNFPGIGNGRLRASVVRPYLEKTLPHSVHVWVRHLDDVLE